MVVGQWARHSCRKAVALLLVAVGVELGVHEAVDLAHGA